MAILFERDGSRLFKPCLVKCAQLPPAIRVQDVLFSSLKLRKDFYKIPKRAIISPTDYVQAPPPFIKLGWGGRVPKILFHQGRTDTNGGHHDWLNREGHGIGAYHYHHKMPAHLHPDGRCPYGGLEASIINPYTGKRINLGRAYYYEDEPYYSLNLVAKALTAWDTTGASLSLLPVLPPYFNCGGSFNACNKGESTHPNGSLGERFSFTYPALPVIGTLRDNTFFDADGDNGGKLRLLCHTKKADADDAVCYAYVALEELRNYMVNNGYFTDFSNIGSGVWNFTVIRPTVHITAPVNGSTFKIGDEIVVQASIENAVRSQLFIGGMFISSCNHLRNKSMITFDSFLLEEGSAGNISIMVESHPGGMAIIAEPAATFLEIVVKPLEDDEPINLYVTAEQLNSLGWSGVTDIMVNDLNTVLKKYEIISIERIRHFLAQCMQETNKGAWLCEGEYIQWSDQNAYEKWYNDNTEYGYAYRGSGYIQLTWEYGYQAFATYLIKQFCPDLNIAWRSPNNTNTGFLERYSEAVSIAEENGYNIDIFKPIVSIGADYVADMFAWEAAGYDWTAKNLNTLVDSLSPENSNDVDRVTEIINKWTPASSYQARRDYYSETLNVIK